jgi:hypothetical protein
LKLSRIHVACALIVASLVIVFTIAVSRTLKAQVESQVAYEQMYESLEVRSPDHHNLIDYYRTCVDNTHTNRHLRSVATITCMDKTQAWSEKLKLTTPFKVIQTDILGGEARVRLSNSGR